MCIIIYIGKGIEMSEEQLTAKEIKVLEFLCKGLTNSEIAEMLNISYSTCKVHVSNILRKTKSANRVCLAIWAYKNGFLDDIV